MTKSPPVLWAGGRWLWQNQAEAGESCDCGTPSQMLRSPTLLLLCPLHPIKADKLDQCKLWIRQLSGFSVAKGKWWAQLLSGAFAVSQVSACHVSCLCWANVKMIWTPDVQECCWWEDGEREHTVSPLCEMWCHLIHRSAEIRSYSCWLWHGKLFTHIKILDSVCDKRQPVILL